MPLSHEEQDLAMLNECLNLLRAASEAVDIVHASLGATRRLALHIHDPATRRLVLQATDRIVAKSTL
jgi:hypothetical protein